MGGGLSSGSVRGDRGSSSPTNLSALWTTTNWNFVHLPERRWLRIVAIMDRGTRNRRLCLAGLAVVLLAANHVAAQSPSPEIAQPGAKWESDLDTGSMVLTPPTAGLVVGPRDNLSLQIERHDIRVTGWSDSTFGALYFQREGGAIVVHGSKPIDSRVYITGDGSVGIATADPRWFAIDRELIGEGWSEPPGALAVDGDIYAERIQSLRLDVLDRLRVGRPIDPSMSGAARDFLHVDAKLQVGGKSALSRSWFTSTNGRTTCSTPIMS
jgi:hypothetical protein